MSGIGIRAMNRFLSYDPNGGKNDSNQSYTLILTLYFRCLLISEFLEQAPRQTL